MLPNFAYLRPGTLKEAARAAQPDTAWLWAGGTDLLGCLREGILDAQTVVSLSGLEKAGGLRGVQETGAGGAAIGALTTITEVAESPVIARLYPGLAQAAFSVASPQLRNQGTIGGNLCQKPRCWYYRGEFHCLRKGGDTCFAAPGQNQFHAVFGSDGLCYYVHPSDTAPALISLDAKVRTAGPDGGRTIPVAGLHARPKQSLLRETVLKPGEIITRVELPPPPEGLVSRYRKVRTRRSWDFAIGGLALAVDLRDGKAADVRLVLSGVAPIPWRSGPAEEAVRGQELTSENIAAAAEAAAAGAEPLEHNAYKLELIKGIVAEELEAAAAQA
jgi:xanthine dehydrogenase YagS FAD-binding subunit